MEKNNNLIHKFVSRRIKILDFDIILFKQYFCSVHLCKQKKYIKYTT